MKLRSSPHRCNPVEQCAKPFLRLVLSADAPSSGRFLEPKSSIFGNGGRRGVALKWREPGGFCTPATVALRKKRAIGPRSIAHWPALGTDGASHDHRNPDRVSGEGAPYPTREVGHRHSHSPCPNTGASSILT